MSSLYASECTRMRLRKPKIFKIFLGEHAPHHPRVNNCRATCSLLQLMTLPPKMGKVMYGPGCVLLITAKTNLLGVDGFGEVDLER